MKWILSTSEFSLFLVLNALIRFTTSIHSRPNDRIRELILDTSQMMDSVEYTKDQWDKFHRKEGVASWQTISDYFQALAHK